MTRSNEMIRKIEEYNRVEKAVSEVMQIPVHMILSKSRKSELVDSRRIIFYIMRKKYFRTFDEISEYYKFNRATVLHHFAKTEDYIKFNVYFRENYISALEMVNKKEKESK